MFVLPRDNHFYAVDIELEKRKVTIYDSMKPPTNGNIILSSADWRKERGWIEPLATFCYEMCGRPNGSATNSKEWNFVEGGHCRGDNKADQHDDLENCAFHAALFLADRLGNQSAKGLHKDMRVLRQYFAMMLCEAFDSARAAALLDQGDRDEVDSDGDSSCEIIEKDAGASCDIPPLNRLPRHVLRRRPFSFDTDGGVKTGQAQGGGGVQQSGGEQSGGAPGASCNLNLLPHSSSTAAS